MADLIVIFRFLGAGFLEVIRLVPVCVLLSLALGMLVGIIQFARIPGVYQLLSAYLIAMRGIPPLVFLLLLFFVGGFGSARIAALFGLSMYHAAYISEIIRGGIRALPKGQFEAADSLALRFHQKMLHIIIPQVWRSTLPAIVGQYIILVKDTALVSALGVMEILYNARQAMQVVYQPILIYFLVGFLFFIVCFSLERLSLFLEKRLT
ncbi:polar amino acid ABC transporter, inner membrane subunit [Candidatus Vecturithrix granuli]|uniref:Polar amino acid ABC transporter, inner membrane subunit n=1 Tax=Vecturithrix granuli TaxID=1499967 RepID=A0A081C8H6_VECG1|nr:polar amino acid ABC transporter, inner membrane subunit [Candidatus Vecturithrix granuli]